MRQYMYLFFYFILLVHMKSASIPMDIDLSTIREGTVTKPDGTKVVTTIQKEGDTTVYTITEQANDGSSHTKTIRKKIGDIVKMGGIKNPLTSVRITSDHNPSQDELVELNADHKPGTVTKPDGTKVVTTVSKSGEDTITTIIETKSDGSETKKVITAKPDGSLKMDTTVKGAKVQGDPQMMKFAMDPKKAAELVKDAVNGTVTKPDGSKVKTTVVKLANGDTETTIETTEKDGAIHIKKITASCDKFKMVEIDFAHLKEGTVTKPDGTVVNTVIVPEYDGTTTITVTERRRDGSETTRTIRKRITGHDAEDLEQMNGEHRPGTKTKPDGTIVHTRIQRKYDGSSVITITETHLDGSETTKIITVGADGSRSMKTHTVGIPVPVTNKRQQLIGQDSDEDEKEKNGIENKPKRQPTKITPAEAKEMLKDVIPGRITKRDGTVVNTTVKEEDGTKITVIETSNPDGTTSKRTIRETF